jgi:hypothetical protein
VTRGGSSVAQFAKNSSRAVDWSRTRRVLKLSTDGHTDADAHTRAAFIARLIRAALPVMDDLPEGPLKREFIAFIRRHGTEHGITLTGYTQPKATLLDAKLEVDARIDELGLGSYAETLTTTQYRELTNGTSIVREQLEVVTRHSIGRHLKDAKRLPLERVAAGHYACGIVVGALAESWRY